MAIEFFWTSGGPYAWRCLLALEIKGVPYTSTLVDLAGGATRTPAFLALNPRATLPVLTDGDVTVRESQAIIHYLDRAYPEPPLYGRTAAEAARIMQTVNEQVSYIEAPLRGIIVPLMFAKGPLDAAAMAASAEALRREFALLEMGLHGQTYLAGDALSAADVHLYPFLPTLERGLAEPEASALDLGLAPIAERYPAIAAWMRRIEALPGHERTVPPHWKAPAASR